MPSRTYDRVLFWFRDDLRLNDNLALRHALDRARQVHAVFVFDPLRWSKTPRGFDKTGPFRTNFLLETLEDLRQQVARAGGELWLEQGAPQEVLPRLARRWGAQAVFATQAYTQEEEDREMELAALLPLHLYHNSVLLDFDDLPFGDRKTPSTFTDFRLRAEERWSVPELAAPPERLWPAPEPAPGPEALPPRRPVRPHPATAFPFGGGSTQAWLRLEQYFWKSQDLARYKVTRDQMLGPGFSSKFSPWLANGAISPREIYWEVKRFEQQHGANESTYWMVFELLWRDFFKLMALKFGPKLFWPGGIKGKPPRGKWDPEAFERWRLGQTGQPFCDANMRELLLTGFMSNRGRQNAASYLVHELGLPWLAGAQWFESQLIDYDPTSNYGNWTYLAGVGNDPRGERTFNLEGQAQRYDPQGEFQRLWLGAQAPPEP